MRDVSFGQYYQADSFVHKLDPRSKLVLTLLFMVGIFFVTSYVEFGVVALFLGCVIALSKVPLKSILRSLRTITVLLVFTAVLNLIFVKKGNVVLDLKIFAIYDQGLVETSKLVLRLSFLITGASLLTLTTTPVDLTHALQSLLTPLAWLKFPVDVFAQIMSLALAFIPNLMEETERIIRAQKARGADFDTGGLIARAKAFVPILIPLLVSGFRRAEELAFAMNARCYGVSAKRTHLRKLHFGWRDGVAVFATVVVFVFVFVTYANRTNWQQITWLYF